MEGQTSTIRVVVADDHEVVRAGICRWLDREAEMEVVGEASSGKDALRLVALHRPALGVAANPAAYQVAMILLSDVEYEVNRRRILVRSVSGR